MILTPKCRAELSACHPVYCASDFMSVCQFHRRRTMPILPTNRVTYFLICLSMSNVLDRIMGMKIIHLPFAWEYLTRLGQCPSKIESRRRPSGICA
ncbi:hypothetical protein M404DRAFT_207489 [Pisolithus tinctorius Marx 270]|uniref:Uncharacterized protein n=1 Tax=Pisolithus tinctorius Marx 270 TaxID=870435 RepID=A0A0C3K181_PISTI|nr:hypothetical protein M404DRAFT_207489 [Pisolithus tinctorius Marx 270]